MPRRGRMASNPGLERAGALRCELHGPINALSQSPDGERVVVAGRDGTCTVQKSRVPSMHALLWWWPQPPRIASTSCLPAIVDRHRVVQLAVLKIVQIVNGAMAQGQNLRIMKKHLNFSSIDVHWHPLECMPS